MERFFPEVTAQTPLFMGGIVNSKGDYIGIFMEDYSCGNRKKIWTRCNEDCIPVRMREMCRDDEDQLQGIYARVNKNGMEVGEETEKRIIDFDCIPWLLKTDVCSHFHELALELEYNLDKLAPYLVRV